MWSPVVSEMYWEVRILAMYVGEIKLDICTSESPCNAAVDTGTSLITAPSEHVVRLHNTLIVNPDCENIEMLPTLTFTLLGDVNVTLRPEDYVCCGFLFNLVLLSSLSNIMYRYSKQHHPCASPQSHQWTFHHPEVPFGSLVMFFYVHSSLYSIVRTGVDWVSLVLFTRVMEMTNI